MTLYYKRLLLSVLIFLPVLSQAAPAINKEDYWLCSTHDQTNKLWTAKSAYKKAAINLAYDSCKKTSALPQTCKTSNSNCDHYIQGMSTRPLWRCTTLDEMASAWKSNYYSNRIDAALASKSYCKNKSPVPETCYTNLVTCFNYNEGL